MPITLANYKESGWRELEKGEIIEKTDMVLPSNKDEFVMFKESSRVIHNPYKNVNTKLMPETVVIRNAKSPVKIDIFCVGLSRKDCANIISIIKENPNFRNHLYNSSTNSDYFRNNFFILNRNPIMGVSDTIGWTNENQNSRDYFRNAVAMNYEGLIEYLNTGKITPIKYNPIIIRAEMNLTLSRLQ